ncbi:unnamed protein product [Parnassius apollo]|uniref:(apollo) hypothetical protein n=1 Tax=Parnassius apollo TaxID=110799 RepID=A0A8S3X1I9_PARAO|nr:unnamed protein product [Parnassius apollo]
MYSFLTLLLMLVYYITIEHHFLSVNDNKKPVLMPWMGVLIYKADNQSVEEVTNIVMIEHRVAIGNAKDITAVDENSLMTSARAMFYTTKGSQWSCGIISYLLHPEFKQGFLNTIVILYLDSVDDPYLWKPIIFMGKTREISKWSNVFSVGYTDRDMVLKQEMFALEYISRTTCEEFYIKEEINFDYLWPTNAVCYKVLSSRKTCVNNAGMVLAGKLTDGWVLMGLSTHGPGCSLPARYINIFPYVRWIRDSTGVTKATRRSSYYHSAIQNVYGFKSFIDMFFKSLRDTSIVLKPELANKSEKLTGCYYDTDYKTLIYRETVILKTYNPLAIGTYALLFFDMNFDKVTCVQLSTVCTAKSDTKLWFYSRAHTSQAMKFAKTYLARIKEKARLDSYLMINDPKFIRSIDNNHLQFRFSFSKFAKIKVAYYGNLNST